MADIVDKVWATECVIMRNYVFWILSFVLRRAYKGLSQKLALERMEFFMQL